MSNLNYIKQLKQDQITILEKKKKVCKHFKNIH